MVEHYSQMWHNAFGVYPTDPTLLRDQLRDTPQKSILLQQILMDVLVRALQQGAATTAEGALLSWFVIFLKNYRIAVAQQAINGFDAWTAYMQSQPQQSTTNPGLTALLGQFYDIPDFAGLVQPTNTDVASCVAGFAVNGILAATITEGALVEMGLQNDGTFLEEFIMSDDAFSFCLNCQDLIEIFKSCFWFGSQQGDGVAAIFSSASDFFGTMSGPFIIVSGMLTIMINAISKIVAMEEARPNLVSNLAQAQSSVVSVDTLNAVLTGTDTVAAKGLNVELGIVLATAMAGGNAGPPADLQAIITGIVNEVVFP